MRRLIFVPAVNRRAMKLGKLAIAKASKKNWTDMGIYTLTFYAYVQENGKLTVHTFVFTLKFTKLLVTDFSFYKGTTILRFTPGIRPRSSLIFTKTTSMECNTN